MPDKNKTRELLDKLISGGISEQEHRELKNLVQEFPEYNDVYQNHQLLMEADSPFEEPATEKLTAMRQSVIRNIRNIELNTSSDWLSDFSDWVRGFVTKPEMAVAAITLLLGFFLGRIAPVDQESISSGLMQQISFLAQENDNFAASKNSPYRYSNIEIKEVNGGEVSLSFDVSTHLEMVREKKDPLVKEVIAQSLLNPTNLGSELKAISYSESMLDTKLKEALIFSMRNAPILAVRQNAMRNLTKYQQDEDIKNAFIEVLKDEESVKMRLMALDYFAEYKIDPDELRQIVETDDIKKSPAVWIKAKKYLENN